MTRFDTVAVAKCGDEEFQKLTVEIRRMQHRGAYYFVEYWRQSVAYRSSGERYERLIGEPAFAGSLNGFSGSGGVCGLLAAQ